MKIQLVPALLIILLNGFFNNQTAAANRLPPVEYFTALQELNTGDIKKDLANIELVAKYNFSETHEELGNRLLFEFDQYSQSNGRHNFSDTHAICAPIFRFFSAYGTFESADTFIQVLREIDKIFINQPDVLNNYRKFITQINRNITLESRHYPPSAETLVRQSISSKGNARLQPISQPLLLPSTQGTAQEATQIELVSSVQEQAKVSVSNADIEDLDQVTEVLKELREQMEARIIGQPEVIESFVSLRRAQLLYGQSLPSKRVLMGLPGNGKDTTVEAFVDAVHGYDKAHEPHMFRVPVMRDKSDLWKALGSATGYKGSDDFPPLLKFLVEHSGGRYVLTEIKVKGEKSQFKVEENPAWIANGRKSLPGFESPENAVLFVNEFHNWSKELKDAFVKQAFEKGVFEINSPNGGLAQIVVPVTFIIATNEGISLLAARELNGQRFGEVLPYARLLENWERVHVDKSLLRNQMLATNGAVNSSRRGESQVGISEELANRILDNELLLLRPLSPESLKLIARLKLAEIQRHVQLASKILGPIEITWSDELVEFLQSYHYIAEDNARPIEDRVKTLVQTPLDRAIETRKIEPTKAGQTLNVSVKVNADKTASLVVTRQVRGGNATVIELPIEATQVDQVRPVIADSRIDEIAAQGEQMKAKVFGVDHIIDRLTADSLITEEARLSRVDAYEADQPARSYMFLGMSSTGKTETSKRLAEVRYKKKNALKIIDFSQVRTIYDLKEKILGTRDAMASNPIPSEFMKEYDRNNGQMLFVFDEVANCPRDVLKALYDVLREPVVTTFVDGKPRAMNGITIVMTGNAGEEWFNQVPKNIPEAQQLDAMLKIYERVMSDRHTRRDLLEKYFSSAFLNRVGENNIYFFGPMGYVAARELTQFKVSEVLERLKPKDGQRGWQVGFVSQQAMVDLIEGIENAGFILREQGASIDRFVKQKFEDQLRHLLLTQKIASGAKIAIEVVEKGQALIYRDQADTSKLTRSLVLKLHIEGHLSSLELVINGKEDVRDTRRSETDQFLTALHEAGHELARFVYFGDKYSPLYISIIPGVTKMGNEWVQYAGVATRELVSDYRMTRQAVIRHIAGLAAGFIAQTLVTKDGRHDEGKSNDMKRATRLAMDAVLRYGLSDKFGPRSVPEGKTNEQFMASLSPQDRDLFVKEYNALLNEGMALAEHALLANYHNALLPLGKLLAEKGHLSREDLLAFYKTHKVYNDHDAEVVNTHYDRMQVTGQKILTSSEQAPKKENKGPLSSSAVALLALSQSRDAELLETVPKPDSIANIQALAEESKAKAVANVALPNWPVFAISSAVAIDPEVQQSIGICDNVLTSKNRRAR